ncbi:hypothetical protein OnM2_064050 [Erysiphe neolycopersici]|uniref:Uncharacterized protein n=1 Tax=Erysiphe neolycopersici TaxID=212602 RepID=A0A420HNE5_9PEZI|nr:hypothetical protein OnM2_064050 [Erysiphe neolycopersici]
MIPDPEALPSLSPSELLIYLLKRQSFFSTLIICQKREDFISSLVSDISLVPQHQKWPKNNDPSKTFSWFSTEESDQNEDYERQNLLLVPTLHQVAISQHTHVVFVPTVTHLRAYLATFPSEMEAKSTSPLDPENNPRDIDSSSKTTFLFVYGLVDLHRDTCEWSAQGLSNTIAGLIESGRRSCKKIVVMEKWAKENFVEGGGDELDANSGGTSRYSIWENRVPILHTSANITGPHFEEQPWSGRNTEIGRILARWFRFGAYNR